MQNCYNTKKIARGEAEDQDGRLTTKHIQTLSFLQEIVNENKSLKIRIEELEAEFVKCSRLHELAENSQQRLKDMQLTCMERTDEITLLLTEKHKEEMMRKVEEGLDVEKKWLEEKRKLTADIEELKQQIANLQAQMGSSSEDQSKLQASQTMVSKLKQDITRLAADNKKLTAENKKHQVALQKQQFIEDRNAALTDELTHANHTNKELQFRLAKLEREAGFEGLKQQEELLTSLRTSLQKLHKEKSIWTTKEEEYTATQQDLESEIAKLRKALGDSERMRGEMHVQLEQIIEELNALKNQQQRASGDNGNSEAFKQYIKVKRELAQVKEENEELKQRLQRSKRGSGGGVVAMLPKIETDESRVSYKSIKSFGK